ncbi:MULTISPECIES: hypothetical protein [unclassified Motilimonas]|uniref:tetratricopeptide repeat protein n=1 Tax=Motilimonas TaxID=1914248 RepID=UPI001E3D8174|nr:MULTISPECIES: hypothetical protein [unclassified Motilimonas]MCE0557271.1 hypothetical protein [Motilimonas sp. E26]MDO6526132.1 hypothetical protein [Motilimonas sp. 1_MG-2023]
MSIILQELQKHIKVELAIIDSLISESPKDALARVVSLVEDMRQTRDDQGYVAVLLKMAEVYWHTMDYQAGLRVCSRVESLLTPELEFQFLTQLQHRIATLNWGLARYRSAQHYWNQALEKSILHNEFELQLEALIGLGNVWRITGNLAQSESALQFALDASILRDYKWIAGKSSILLAWSLFLQKKYVEMLPILARCNEFLADCPDQTWHAEIHDFRGLALLYSGHPEEAGSEIKQALQIATENNLAWMSAHASVSSARVAKKQGQLSQANDYLEAAERLAQGFDQGELLSQICLERTEICRRLGQDKEALQHYRDYRRYDLNLIREQSLSKGSDEFLSSRGQLDLRSKQLIKRMNVGDFVSQIQHYPQMRQRGAWLFSCRTRLDEPDLVVFEIEFASEQQCDHAVPLLHSLLQETDRGVIWGMQSIALLMAANLSERESLRLHIEQLLVAYPWWRTVKAEVAATVTMFNVSDFLSLAASTQGGEQ